MRATPTFRAWPLGLALLVLGCGKPSAGPNAPAASGEAAPVKASFDTLQKALEEHEQYPEKLWLLLDRPCQQEAERAARAWKKAFADADILLVQQELGIGQAQLEKLDGPGFLQTIAFYDGPVQAIALSRKIAAVRVEGDTATVDYVTPKGATEQLTFAREGGNWKARLPIKLPRR